MVVDATPSPKVTRLRLSLDSPCDLDGLSTADSILFFVLFLILFIITFSFPFLPLCVRPTGLGKALQQRPRPLPRRAVHRVIGLRQLHAFCAAVGDDQNSVVAEVAGARLNLPRDGPLEPLDTLPQHYRPLYEFSASAAGAKLARTHPVGDFEGQGLFVFAEVIVDLQGC